MARGKQHMKNAGAGRQGPPRAPSAGAAGGAQRGGPISPAETRLMVIAALAALAAFLVALLARAEVVPETPGALVALAIAVVVIAASARAWLGGGHWADRDRLPIATPIALAGGAVAAALGVLVSPGVGVLVSVLVALGSAAFLGIALSGRRRPRGGPPA